MFIFLKSLLKLAFAFKSNNEYNGRCYCLCNGGKWNFIRKVHVPFTSLYMKYIDKLKLFFVLFIPSEGCRQTELMITPTFSFCYLDFHIFPLFPFLSSNLNSLKPSHSSSICVDGAPSHNPEKAVSPLKLSLHRARLKSSSSH